MGNHSAGTAMVRTATALFDQIDKTGQTPLEILDIACGPWRNTDAEFNEENAPYKPFGKLLALAFAPDETFDLNENTLDDDQWERWWQTVLEPFRERFGLY